MSGLPAITIIISVVLLVVQHVHQVTEQLPTVPTNLVLIEASKNFYAPEAHIM